MSRGVPVCLPACLPVAVRGYLPASKELKGNLMDSAAEQDLIRELSQRKRNLLLELRNYDDNAKVSQKACLEGSLWVPCWVSAGVFVSETHTHHSRARAALFQCVSDSEGMGVIPANTQLQTALAVRAASQGQKAHVELSISTPNGRVSAAGLLLPLWSA